MLETVYNIKNNKRRDSEETEFKYTQLKKYIKGLLKNKSSNFFFSCFILKIKIIK